MAILRDLFRQAVWPVVVGGGADPIGFLRKPAFGVVGIEGCGLSRRFNYGGKLPQSVANGSGGLAGWRGGREGACGIVEGPRKGLVEAIRQGGAAPVLVVTEVDGPIQRGFGVVRIDRIIQQTARIEGPGRDKAERGNRGGAVPVGVVAARGRATKRILGGIQALGGVIKVGRDVAQSVLRFPQEIAMLLVGVRLRRDLVGAAFDGEQVAQGVVIEVGRTPAGVDRVIDVAGSIVRRFGDTLGRALPKDGLGALPAVVIFVGRFRAVPIDHLGDIAQRIVGNEIAVGMVLGILDHAAGIVFRVRDTPRIAPGVEILVFDRRGIRRREFRNHTPGRIVVKAGDNIAWRGNGFDVQGVNEGAFRAASRMKIVISVAGDIALEICHMQRAALRIQLDGTSIAGGIGLANQHMVGVVRIGSDTSARGDTLGQAIRTVVKP